MRKKTKLQGSLRKNAENQLINTPLTAASSSSVDHLLHELHVHQIELEMQNEELRLTHIALEASRDRYLNLYEYAPVGYLTLTREGLIAEANLTAAKLFGMERNQLLNRLFAGLVSSQDGDRWYLFFADTVKHNTQRNIELTLKSDNNCEFPVQLDCLCATYGDQDFMLRITLVDITERRVLNQLTSMINIVIDEFLILDLSGNVLQVNEAYAKTSGYSIAELKTMHISQLESVAEPEQVKPHLAKIVAQGYDQFETRHRHKDGHNIDIEVSVTFLPEFQQFAVFCRDITERKVMEEKLNLTQHAINSCNNGIIITGLEDTDWAIIYANDAFIHMTGYSIQELLGHNPRMLQHHDRVQPGIFELRTALQYSNKTYAILRNYRKDGSLFWNEVYISPLRDKQGKITHYIGVQNDVTRRVEIETALSKSEERMRSIINNVSDGIIIFDKNGIIESANPFVERLFGYPAEELNGHNINKLMPEPNRGQHDSYLTNYLGDGKPKTTCFRRELTGLRKNGSFFPMELGISEFNVEKRHLFLGTVHDITQNKQAEYTLRDLSGHLETAREAERTRIAGEIHDELGSILTALKMDLGWLNKQLPIDLSLCHQKISVMNQNLDDGVRSIRRIIADLRPSILDHLGLLTAIDWRLDEFKEQTGMQCVLSIPNNKVEMDENRDIVVFRIMQEALTNISLHSKATHVTLNVETDSDSLMMKITDNGCGMTKAQLHKPGKYGILGMHERALHFGGKVAIDSHPGKGVTLVLNMPLRSPSTPFVKRRGRRMGDLHD
jgi:PAS domain S-box-containing protein